MANRIPLVIVTGRQQELPSGDALTSDTTGNAATATALATARAINGVDFDGTAAITVIDLPARTRARRYG